MIYCIYQLGDNRITGETDKPIVNNTLLEKYFDVAVEVIISHAGSAQIYHIEFLNKENYDDRAIGGRRSFLIMSEVNITDEDLIVLKLRDDRFFILNNCVQGNLEDYSCQDADVTVIV